MPTFFSRRRLFGSARYIKAVTKVPPARTAADSVSISASPTRRYGAGDYAATILADGPDAYYRLGESSGTTMVDSSGFGHDGTYSNNPTFGAAGLIADTNTAVTFNHVPLSAGDVTAPAWIASPSQTLECWVNITTTTPSTNQGICGFRTNSDTANSFYITLLTNGNFEMRRVNSTGGGVDLNPAATVGIHHIVFVYDNSTLKQTAYIDGVQVAQASHSGSLAAGPNFGVGHDGATAFSSYTDFTVDEVAYYAGQHLTPAQILNHYQKGWSNLVRTASDSVTVSSAVYGRYPGIVLSDNPYAYWRLGEPSGSTAVDVIGAAHNGTLTGGNAPPTQGATSLIANDTDTSYNFVAGDFPIVTVDGVASLFSGTKSWSIEAWVNHTADSNFRYVFDCEDSGGTNQPALLQSQSTVTWMARTDAAGGQDTTSGPPIGAGTHHMVATYDGANMRIYVDGVLNAGPTASTRSAGTGTTAGIGNHRATMGVPFGGRLDEVAVYGTALSATRILAHYNGGKATGASVTASDSVTTSTSVARTGQFFRTAADSLTVSAALNETQQLQRTAADSVTTSSSVADTATHSRAVSDSVSTSDALAETQSLFRTAADSVSTSTSVATTTAWARSAADSVTTATSVARTVGLNRTASDSVTTADSLNEVESLQRTAADSVTTATSVGRTGSFHPTVADSVTTSDSVAGIKTLNRTASDSVTTSDAVQRVEADQRTATDNVTFSDSVSRTQQLFRTAADSVSTSTTVAVSGQSRSVADSVTTSDSVSRAGSTFLRTASDSVSTSTSVTDTATHARTAADSVSTSDSIAETQQLFRTASDSVTTSASVGRTATFGRTASDSVTTSDAPTIIRSLVRSVADSVTTSDVPSRAGTFNRTASDSVSTSTSAVGAAAHPRTASDSVTTSDSVARTGAFTRTAADSVTTSASVSGVKGNAVSTNDNVTISDAVSRTVNLVRTAADSVSTSTSVSANKTAPRTAADSVTTSDSVSRTGTFGRTAADSVTTTAATSQIGIHPRTASDSVTFTATATWTGHFNRSFTLDAWILGAGNQAAFTLDAVIRATRTGTFTLDAVLRRARTASFTLDAWVSVPSTHAFTVDAVVRGTASASMRVDAVLLGGRVGAFGVDSILKRTSQAGLTADAVIKATRTGGIATSAVLLSPRQASFSARAEIVAKHFRLDAFFIASNVKFFELYAEISPLIPAHVEADCSAVTISASMSAVSVSSDITAATVVADMDIADEIPAVADMTAVTVSATVQGPPGMSLVFVQGDTAPDITAVLHEEDTPANIVDLTGATVRFQMRMSDDHRYQVNAIASVTDAPNGKVRYSWGANDLARSGVFWAQWEITYPGGRIQTTRPPVQITVDRQ